jgi:hypothetical protein
MDRIFDAIATLLPLSLDPHAFADPAHREQILAQLRVLEGSAAELERHAGGRDAGFQFLSQSLSRDVEELAWQFEQGEADAARYQVVGLTQDCVACHSRLPSARQFDMAGKLTQRVEIASLAPPERARLLTAVRRFDDALSTWEATFADPKIPPERFDITGDLVDYLTVAIRVRGDLPRARRTLEALARRPDTPTYLRRHLAVWIESLDALAGVAKETPTLARARELVEHANGLSVFPAGRERVVYDLVASSLLHRLVSDSPQPGPELAEAYYLLGVIEARTIDSYWVPQTELHLEAAIRADPGSPVAQKAYAALEEYVLSGYGGLSGDYAPADVRAHLAELRKLAEGRAPAAPGPGEGRR